MANERTSLINVLGGRSVVELQEEEGDDIRQIIANQLSKYQPRKPSNSLIGILQGRSVVELQESDDLLKVS